MAKILNIKNMIKAGIVFKVFEPLMTMLILIISGNKLLIIDLN